MTKKPLELYIHIPFCVKKCAYCDFLSGPSTLEVREAYVNCLIEEICHCKHAGVGDSDNKWAPCDPENYEVVSAFFGGGTPSILKPDQIRRIMTALKEVFCWNSDAEVTIEANPGTVDEEKLRNYLDCGINRISFGLQSADNEELRKLGRIHTWEEFLDSFHQARIAGFTNINVDLMSALPGQTVDSWRKTLEKVLELKPEHISAYSLIIEEGTPFAQRELDLPDEDTEYQMYEDTAEILGTYGYQQYEISNYAKPGYMCRHNAGYWQRREYLGFGLGASSLYRELRFSNTRRMQEYLTDSGKLEQIRKEVTVLSRNEQIEEFMFLGLRMTEGISEKLFKETFGVRIMDIYGDILQKYEAIGFMEHIETKWCLTRKGIHVSNHILADFLLDE